MASERTANNGTKTPSKKVTCNSFSNNFVNDDLTTDHNGNSFQSVDGCHNESNSLIDQLRNFTSQSESGTQTTLYDVLLQLSTSPFMTNKTKHEKKSRIYERETNELKDVICSLNRLVHILTNFKRVSSEYIQTMYQLINAIVQQDSEHMQTAQQNITDLEHELNLWNQKYQMLSTCNELRASDSISANDSHMNFAEILQEKFGLDQQIVSSNFTNEEQMSPEQNETCDTLMSDANSQDKPPMIVPQMLNSTNYSNTSSPLIAAVIANLTGSDEERPQAESSRSQLDNVSDSNSSNAVSTYSFVMCPITNKFKCNRQGCKYSHSLRQRMVMHQRVHSGEMIYACNISGCDYLTNLKGNMKLHKKRRHKVDIDLTDDVVFADEMDKATNAAATNSDCPEDYSTKEAKTSLPTSNESSQNNVKETPMLKCSVEGCSYQSRFRRYMAAHELEHVGITPFSCRYPNCNYGSKYQSNIYTHERIHRNERFTCDFKDCDFSTTWKSSIKAHRLKHLRHYNLTQESVL